MSILCEKWKNIREPLEKTDGFALLEVLVILMIVTILTAALYGIAGSSYRRIISKVHENEAYYAAAATIQLLAKDIIAGDIDEESIAYELVYGAGMKKRMTNLVFRSEDEGEEIPFPVCVWSECDGERLLLAAEVTCCGIKKQVTLQLKKKETKESEEVKERWVPVLYGV